MRYIFFLLLIPTLSFSQDKKDTKIILNASPSFNEVAMYLLDEGYTFEEKDSVARYIVTKERQVKHMVVANQKIKIIFKDNQLIFSSLLNLPIIDKTYSPLLFEGSTKSVNKKGWAEMERIAKHFGTDITYEK